MLVVLVYYYSEQTKDTHLLQGEAEIQRKHVFNKKNRKLKVEIFDEKNSQLQRNLNLKISALNRGCRKKTDLQNCG